MSRALPECADSWHCAQSRTAGDAESRLFARLSLAGLPRGGGDGDAIRMGILNIMRENGIREGHRPVRPALAACPSMETL